MLRQEGPPASPLSPLKLSHTTIQPFCIFKPQEGRPTSAPTKPIKCLPGVREEWPKVNVLWSLLSFHVSPLLCCEYQVCRRVLWPEYTIQIPQHVTDNVIQQTVQKNASQRHSSPGQPWDPGGNYHNQSVPPSIVPLNILESLSAEVSKGMWTLPSELVKPPCFQQWQESATFLSSSLVWFIFCELGWLAGRCCFYHDRWQWLKPTCASR